MDPNHTAMKEEEMRAFTWKHVINHPWAYAKAMELANVKAVVRALDVMAALKNSSQFLVTGFSKRGLASWLTAAVDDRVRAIMPGCHDLNIYALIHEQMKSFNAIPYFAAPYAAAGVPSSLDTYGGKALFSMIDPIYFQSRLEGVQKFIMATSNDDFFTVDNSKNWWDNVSEPKVYNMLPNHRHVIQMHKEDLLPSAVAFAQAVLHNKAPPKISWTSKNGTITVWQEEAPEGLQPKSVKFFTADTCEWSDKRDFRKLTDYKGPECFECGLRVDLFTVGGCLMRSGRFDHQEMDPSLLEWNATVEAPEVGYRAGYFQFVYDGPLGDVPWTMSTTATVMPEEYPFADCVGTGCPSDRVTKNLKG
eukprot:CAMPEP_0171079342 /NCGR_PEP_ID=MMETSP0766_2-20121228/15199_1 /TAXON_ID=439317 /ORGANISM="Gambierdiscus australes, Strain CAWD 149" /LENGTH=361 /DNA_ID=CAMNT_0011536523 /DNA_START=1 /DNA_END=1086 /DNA_ORIENTATION=+